MLRIIPLQKLPYYLANSWRMKASNQMVLCVFYVVTYMRHTSNLENAIDFASHYIYAHLNGLGGLRRASGRRRWRSRRGRCG